MFANTPLIVVTGTGTGIGKTHIACALASALKDKLRVIAIKPIESGCTDDFESDASRLRSAGSDIILPVAPYVFAEAISPHLAARRCGRSIELTRVVSFVQQARRVADLVIAELAGGLWSPLGHTLFNADVARELRPNALLLVVSDRLGAIHDAVSAVIAASSRGVSISAIAMSAPAEIDSSTGSNGQEIAALTGVPVVFEAPRTDFAQLGKCADVRRFVAQYAGQARDGGGKGLLHPILG